MRTLQTSVRASEDVAIGRAFVVRRATVKAQHQRGSDSEELQLFDAALALSTEQIAQMAESNDIFAAHLEIVEDPMLREGVEAHIAEGEDVVAAVESASQELVAMFEAMDDEYLSARAADIKDIFARIQANLAGGVVNPFEGVEDGDIVVDTELFPSDMVLLDLSKVRGFVTAQGSTTSHVCIIARNHSLAAVVGLGNEVLQIEHGATIIVDGAAGTVIVEPDNETIDHYRLQQANIAAMRQEQQSVAQSELSYNGEHIAVMANAGSVADVEQAMAAGADGVGLFRSEFLYMQSTEEPTEDAQYEAYSAAARACGGKPITIRTLDIGGDKALTYLAFPKEENPFLGWRAIRVSLELRDMFCRQLRAILRAATEGDVRIMFPMVVSLEELLEAKQLLEQCKASLAEQGVAYRSDIKVGVMIETPAAVFIADTLAAHCDFFSIGTNDLVQYTMAADRANVKVAHLYNPYSEAVQRAVCQTIGAAKRAGIECSMCGEFASDSAATATLVEAGLRKFSVNIGSVAKIKYTISKL
ncbi:MAG: phosphoenolpyruvate--protein phosphotransferase [Alistipes sp.]|nr:phosphoenolpyruvate--protein phosphotransferase [Alistipes sp.]